MMTKAEVVVLLDHLATAFRAEVPAEAVNVWHAQLQDFDADAALVVADQLIATDEFFPKPAKFREMYRLLTPERPRTQNYASTSCTFCRGTGWGESSPYENNGHLYESVMPCSSCNPKGYERWRNVWAPDQALRRRLRGASSPSDRLPANPREGIELGRTALKHVDDLEPF